MMSKKDEYDEIYLQNGEFGLEYTYKNHTLGKERVIHPDDVRKIGPSKHDENIIFVRCGRCDVYMDYVHGIGNSFSGKWMCPKCGTYVKETTVNRYIGELPDLVNIDDDDYDDIY